MQLLDTYILMWNTSSSCLIFYWVLEPSYYSLHLWQNLLLLSQLIPLMYLLILFTVSILHFSNASLLFLHILFSISQFLPFFLGGGFSICNFFLRSSYKICQDHKRIIYYVDMYPFFSYFLLLFIIKFYLLLLLLLFLLLKEWIDRQHGEVNYHLTRLLSGHRNFNAYLYRMGKEQSPAWWLSPRRRLAQIFQVLQIHKREDGTENGAREVHIWECSCAYASW